MGYLIHITHVLKNEINTSSNQNIININVDILNNLFHGERDRLNENLSFFYC